MSQLLSNPQEVSGNLQNYAENGFSSQIDENEKSSKVLGGLFGKRDLYAVGEGELALGVKVGQTVSAASRFMSNMGDVINDATTTPDTTKPLDFSFGEREEMYNQIDQDFQDLKKQSRPDPYTTGYVGQVASGLVGIVPLYMLPGGIAVASAVEGTASLKDAKAEGFTDSEATGKAALDAMWAAVYGVVPASFKYSKPVSATLGAAASATTGIASRYSTSAYLEHIGKDEMAQQYKAFDTEALFTDMVFGAAFGYGLGKTPPSLVADAAVAHEARYREVNSSIGIPETTQARVAHNQAFELARQQLLEADLPVNVEPVIKGHKFSDHIPNEDVADIISNTLNDFGFHDAVKELRVVEKVAENYGLEKTSDSYDSLGVYAKPETVTSRLANKINKKFDESVKEYNSRPDSMNGKILNTDIARELSPDYLKNRTLSGDVHEPASKFVKDLYAQKLKEAPKLGEENAVLFTAGGTGSGKSTAIAQHMDVNKYQIVFDTNMNGFESSDKKIKQALDAGKTVDIAMVYRDPVEALTGGAFPRAMRQANEFGSGRTVPLTDHINTHVGAADSIIKLAEKYKNDERVNIHVIDNSKGAGKAEAATIDLLKAHDYTNTERDVRRAADEEYRQGRITKQIYEGFQKESGTRAGEITQQASNSSVIPNSDGEPIAAQSAMNTADSQIQSATELAKSFEIAADCSMRFGQ